MFSDFLFSLPWWAVILLVYLPIAFAFGLLAFGLCRAAADGDRQARVARADVEAERERLDALNRVAGGSGSGWWRR